MVAGADRIAVEYAHTTMYAQAMEFAVRIAAPALTASIDDDASAGSDVERGRHRRLAEAERMLTDALLSRRVPDGLAARLGEARAARNHLAHDFWLGALPRLVGGDADSVVADLERARDLFASVLSQLFAAVFEPVLEVRGVDEEAVTGFVTALFAACLSGALRDVDLLEDADEVLTRVAALVQVQQPPAVM